MKIYTHGKNLLYNNTQPLHSLPWKLVQCCVDKVFAGHITVLFPCRRVMRMPITASSSSPCWATLAGSWPVQNPAPYQSCYLACWTLSEWSGWTLITTGAGRGSTACSGRYVCGCEGVRCVCVCVCVCVHVQVWPTYWNNRNFKEAIIH